MKNKFIRIVFTDGTPQETVDKISRKIAILLSTLDIVTVQFVGEEEEDNDEEVGDEQNA